VYLVMSDDELRADYAERRAAGILTPR